MRPLIPLGRLFRHHLGRLHSPTPAHELLRSERGGLSVCMVPASCHTASSSLCLHSVNATNVSVQPRQTVTAAVCSNGHSNRMVLQAPAAPLVRPATAPWRSSLQSRSNTRTFRTHVRAASSKSSGGKTKTFYRCKECGWESLQHFGQCKCKKWGTLEEHVITPPPPPSQASGAAAAAALLRDGGSSRPKPRRSPTTTSSSGSSRAPTQSVQYIDSSDSSVDYNYQEQQITPGDDFPEELYQQEHFLPQQQQFGSSSSSSRAGWISTDDLAVPMRLDQISESEREFRLPLFGPTGQEMSRVLGGGLVPGSVVLVGGEPGMGKSTLLLQVAGLVAHACSSTSNSAYQQQQQQRVSSSSSTSVVNTDTDDDLPLAARRAAAAATNSSSSNASTVHWLDEANSAAAAAAAADGSSSSSSDSLVMPEGLRDRPVLYFTAEENISQVHDRARRLGLLSRNLDLQLMAENRAEKIGGVMQELNPAVAIIDSIQTIALPNVPGRPGSVSQVRECATFLLHVAKSLGCATFLVGHVTKSGDIAGPKHLEHLVDVVLYLQSAAGASAQELRMLRAIKNRHGRVGELGLFKMQNSGLIAVKDASIFLTDRSAAAAAGSSSDGDDDSSSNRVGTAICVVQEGIRPLPLEIQALATSRIQQNPDSESDDENNTFVTTNDLLYGSGSNSDVTSSEAEEASSTNDDDSVSEEESNTVTVVESPRRGRGGRSDDLAPQKRLYIGIRDTPRMSMLLELLSKYSPIKSHLYNLFVNVVSGFRIPLGETSTDLAILSAIASSVLDRPIPDKTALLAEVGLGGELRPVQNMELRVLELSKLGFSQVIIPARGPRDSPLRPEDVGGIRVVEKRTLRSALAHLFGDERLRMYGSSRRRDKQGSSSISSTNGNGGGGRTSSSNGNKRAAGSRRRSRG